MNQTTHATSTTRADQLFAAFAKFHRENPEVWNLFERYTLATIDAGHSNYSANAVFERIRWHVDIETSGGSALKLNNNFRCFYARLFHAAYPHYAGYFRNRRRASEGQGAHETDIQEWRALPAGDEAALRTRLIALLAPTTQEAAA